MRIATLEAKLAEATADRDRESAVNNALEADRDAAIAEVQLWQSDDALRAEVDRLRAAIEPTAENLAIVADHFNAIATPAATTLTFSPTAAGRALLAAMAAIRARAGEGSAPGSSLRERVEAACRDLEEQARAWPPTREADGVRLATHTVRAALRQP